MSMGPDLLWTSVDDNEHLIDCAEGDNYYVPVPKRGNEGVEVRTDFIENFNQSPATLDVTMWKNNGTYNPGTATYAEGGIEVTDDGKNYHFLLLPGVEEQDRIISTWKKDKPVWTISKSDDCPNVELQSGSAGSRLLTEKFTKMSDEIDPSSNYKLMVYKGNEGRPIRVIKNGVDVSDQFTELSTDDYYMYNLDPTEDEAWEISYVAQRRVHFKTVGSPKNVTIYRLRDVTNKRYLAGINTVNSPLIDRTDLLNEGMTYQWQLLGPAGKNIKRVTINGEEVQVTGDNTTLLPEITLGQFDVEILVEFTEDFMVNAYATNDAMVAIGGIKANGEIVNESSMDSYLHKKIDAANGVRVAFLPAEGDVLRCIKWGQYGNGEFQVGDGYTTKEMIDGKEWYVITLPADVAEANALPNIDIFAIFDKPNSLTYDLNNDGTVNITDVILLVNKILNE
jgi:hypothetical protein